jgi:hypothetical protein
MVTPVSVFSFVYRLLAAGLLGATLGVERRWRQRMAGTRTNALVAPGAAAFVMAGSLLGGNMGSNPVGDAPAFEAVPRVFRRTRKLRARRDTAKTEATAAEKGWHRNYGKANNGCRDAPSFDGRAVVPLPALFTRSWCLHRELSTTSSATRATKSLQNCFS